MTSLLKIIELLIENKPMQSFIIPISIIFLTFMILQFTYFYFKTEDFFNFYSLNKKKKLLELSQDPEIKKYIQQEIENSIFFKTTGVIDSSTYPKLKKFLNISSTQLYKNDLRFYKADFYIKNNKLSLKKNTFFKAFRLPILKIFSLFSLLITILFLTIFLILILANLFQILPSNNFKEITIALTISITYLFLTINLRAAIPKHKRWTILKKLAIFNNEAKSNN